MAAAGRSRGVSRISEARAGEVRPMRRKTDTTAWLKGNTHVHTTRSDGDAPPAEAVRWYADRGYDFLAITDHNHYLTPQQAAELHRPSGFVVIGGSELSYRSSAPARPVDVCSLGGSGADPPSRGAVRIDGDPAATLQAALDAAADAGGLAIICHPCWHWALSAEDLLAARGAFLLEVWNPSSQCNSVPVAGVDSPEDLWDRLLTAGRRVWAVAADDAHRLVAPGAPPQDGGGLAWVRVAGAPRSAEAVLAAMATGRFYCSTGIELTEWSAGPERYSLKVRPVDDRKYAIHLIGREGRCLLSHTGTEVTYRPQGQEGYVRARIEDTMGCRCWTQPWFPQ
jgi:hypothetical protein